MYHGALRALEFDRIVATVCRFAQTPPGRAKLYLPFEHAIVLELTIDSPGERGELSVNGAAAVL